MMSGRSSDKVLFKDSIFGLLEYLGQVSQLKPIIVIEAILLVRRKDLWDKLESSSIDYEENVF